MDDKWEKPANQGGAEGKKRLFTPLFADGIAAISSVMAGGLTFWREVLSESYSNFTSLDLADDVRKNTAPSSALRPLSVINTM